jgi:hypothetical protein
VETRFTTPARLRESSKHPSHRASRVIDHIDDICRRFIAACPFVIVASRGADGRLDLSAARKPLPRYGAVEGALARGLLRRAPTSTTHVHASTGGRPPTTRVTLAHTTPCTPNPGSLIMLYDPLGRR